MIELVKTTGITVSTITGLIFPLLIVAVVVGACSPSTAPTPTIVAPPPAPTPTIVALPAPTPTIVAPPAPTPTIIAPPAPTPTIVAPPAPTPTIAPPTPTFTFVEPARIEFIDSFGLGGDPYVVGLIQSSINHHLSSVAVECQILYDEVQIANISERTNGLRPNGKWSFVSRVFQELDLPTDDLDINCQVDYRRASDNDADDSWFMIIDEPRIEFIDSFGLGGDPYVVGLIQSNIDRHLSSVTVECQILYDEVQIADISERTNGLRPSGKWSFVSRVSQRLDVPTDDVGINCQADYRLAADNDADEPPFTIVEEPSIKVEQFGTDIVGVVQYTRDRPLNFVTVNCQIIHNGVQIALLIVPVACNPTACGALVRVSWAQGSETPLRIHTLRIMLK